MDPKHTHQWEQAGAALTEMAASMANYFKKLTGEGFTRAEALVLTKAAQTSLFAGASHREDDEEEGS